MDKSKWIADNAMDLKNGNSIPPSYPNEMMVKIFSSGYYSGLFGQAVAPGKVALDVGCGYGNNLIYFLDRGLEGHAIDVTPDMVDLAAKNLKRLGYQNATVQVGENAKIPYPDQKFDYLISVNTIHYEKDETGIRAAFQEFRRVVKAGAKVFIMTAGPGHEIRAKAIRHGILNYEVKDYGFRSNQPFAFFDNKEQLGEMAKNYFSQVEVGSLKEVYSTRTLEFLYALCIC